MSKPAERLREASKVALDAAARLYNIAAEVVEPERPGDASLRVAEYIQESAHEIRRHGLWLQGEADSASQAHEQV